MRYSVVSTVALIASLGATLVVPSAAVRGRPSVSPDLDVLFVGAHPDDEASMLSTFGQWRQNHGVRTGVVTISRGEGGGNAVGPEEGSALGALREREERRAVGKAGITEVYNLDEADIYYTVSAPLTERAWRHDDVLGKLVRVVRQTRPEVVVTMDPAPIPSNHGNHQYAARLALEAYRVAADPTTFSEQITEEGLAPWAVRRVVSHPDGTPPETLGPQCERRTAPPSTAGRWYGVWAGRRTPEGSTWAQRERAAEREYASQGWASKPDVPEDPARIGCDHLTELANRAPHAIGTHAGTTAVLRGALLPTSDTLPVGTGVSVIPDRSSVVPGRALGLRVRVTAPQRRALPSGAATLKVPQGWKVRGQSRYPALPPGTSADVEMTVRVPQDSQTKRVALPVRLTSPAGGGVTELRLDVVPAIVAEQAPLPGVAEFRRWSANAGFPLLADTVGPVRTVPVGGTSAIPVWVRNHDTSTASGFVRMALPRGFTTSNPRRTFRDLAPGAATTVNFRVDSTDPRMPTGMQGGDHRYSLTTEAGGTARTNAALELVPSTYISRAAKPPVVDGIARPPEYPGPVLDVSSRWEGEACESRADCSANARVSWHGDLLHVAVDVIDDRAGSLLAPKDCKRHWRTDAVEIAIDPQGDSENTSSTFKLGVLPRTDDPAAGNPPCFARDADHHQGPGNTTAPGVRVASQPRPDGYALEMAIPFGVLPGTVDPLHMGLNLLVYDSDTDDKTGQTRLGWSTWGGVQGDPYRWGRALVEGRAPEEPVDPPPPRLPVGALSSIDSPMSIAQAVRLGTSLGAAPPAGEWGTRVIGAAEGPAGVISARLAAHGHGRAHVFVVDRSGSVLADRILSIEEQGLRMLSLHIGNGKPYRVLVGFRTPNGATEASAWRIH